MISTGDASLGMDSIGTSRDGPKIWGSILDLVGLC